MKKKPNSVVVSALVIFVSLATAGVYGFSQYWWFSTSIGEHKRSAGQNASVDDFIHGKSSSLSGYDQAMNK